MHTRGVGNPALPGRTSAQRHLCVQKMCAVMALHGKCGGWEKLGRLPAGKIGAWEANGNKLGGSWNQDRGIGGAGQDSKEKGSPAGVKRHVFSRGPGRLGKSPVLAADSSGLPRCEQMQLARCDPESDPQPGRTPVRGRGFLRRPGWSAGVRSWLSTALTSGAHRLNGSSHLRLPSSWDSTCAPPGLATFCIFCVDGVLPVHRLVWNSWAEAILLPQVPKVLGLQVGASAPGLILLLSPERHPSGTHAVSEWDGVKRFGLYRGDWLKEAVWAGPDPERLELSWGRKCGQTCQGAAGTERKPVKTSERCHLHPQAELLGAKLLPPHPGFQPPA
ncbi:uncharacterized protein LOC103794217 [Callithrix jacchus]